MFSHPSDWLQVLKMPALTLLVCVILLSGQHATATPIDQQLGVTLNNQGFVLAQQGRFQEAQALYQQALPHLIANDARTQINRAATLNNLGVASMQQHNLQAAYQAFTEALALREQYLGSQNAFTLLSRHNLAVVLMSGQQMVLACEQMQQAYSGRLSTLGNAHADTQLSLKLLKQIPKCTVPH